MKNNRIVVIALGGIMIAAGAIGAAACSDTTPGTGVPSNGVDATAKVDGGGTDEDTGTGDDTGTTQKDGSAGADAAKECGSPPSLHPTPDAGIYCPFQADGGPDASRNCENLPGTHCCNYPQAANKPSTCNTVATACGPEADAGGADFGCDEPNDCAVSSTGTAHCCLRGTVKVDAVCKTSFGSLVKGTHCSAGACANAGEIELCSTQADCTVAGETCTPFSTKAKELGACVK